METERHRHPVQAQAQTPGEFMNFYLRTKKEMHDARWERYQRMQDKYFEGEIQKVRGLEGTIFFWWPEHVVKVEVEASHNDEAQVTTLRFAHTRNEFFVRYHLRLAGEQWQICRHENSCRKCKGIGFQLTGQTCPGCKGTGWLGQ